LCFPFSNQSLAAGRRQQKRHQVAEFIRAQALVQAFGINESVAGVTLLTVLRRSVTVGRRVGQRERSVSLLHDAGEASPPASSTTLAMYRIDGALGSRGLSTPIRSRYG